MHINDIVSIALRRPTLGSFPSLFSTLSDCRCCPYISRHPPVPTADPGIWTEQPWALCASSTSLAHMVYLQAAAGSISTVFEQTKLLVSSSATKWRCCCLTSSTRIRALQLWLCTARNVHKAMLNSVIRNWGGPRGLSLRARAEANPPPRADRQLAGLH